MLIRKTHPPIPKQVNSIKTASFYLNYYYQEWAWDEIQVMDAST